MPKIPSRPAIDLSGKWVVELPSLPPEFLAQTPDPHILIVHKEFYRFTATYKVFGAAGDVAFNAKEEDIINGTFRYHHGDDLPFVWKRVKQDETCSETGTKVTPC